MITIRPATLRDMTDEFTFRVGYAVIDWEANHRRAWSNYIAGRPLDEGMAPIRYIPREDGVTEVRVKLVK